MGGVRERVSGVSIPYSSGQKRGPLTLSLSHPLTLSPFQSPTHRDKNGDSGSSISGSRLTSFLSFTAQKHTLLHFCLFLVNHNHGPAAEREQSWTIHRPSTLALNLNRAYPEQAFPTDPVYATVKVPCRCLVSLYTTAPHQAPIRQHLTIILRLCPPFALRLDLRSPSGRNTTAERPIPSPSHHHMTLLLLRLPAA